ncbi:MAG: BCCT family transporter [Planctomycetota bacterium]
MRRPRGTTIALVLILVVVTGLAMLAPAAYSSGARSVQAWLDPMLRWFYPLCVICFLGFMIWLGLGPHRVVRLDVGDRGPEFGTAAWLSMLFAAGTGVGLLFWSIAEPLRHFGGNPFVDSRTGSPPERAQMGLLLTYFHWGLNGWAIFATTGLAMAYAGFRRERTLSVRATLAPVLGRHTDGPVGHGVDVLAALATVFGITTTLGLGVQQMNAGLAHVGGWQQSDALQIGIIALVTTAALISVLTGLSRGIRILSETNIVLSLLLLGIFLVAGPTNELLARLLQTSGAYIRELPHLSFYAGVDGAAAWQSDWTVFYWGWWIAWSPFVGLFIARISRGRTIGEYVAGVLLVPSAFSFLWIALLGGSALHLQLQGATDLVAVVREDVATALFVTIDALAMPGWLTSGTHWLALALIGIYYVTSADSGTVVLTTLFMGGRDRASRLTRGGTGETSAADSEHERDDRREG